MKNVLLSPATPLRLSLAIVAWEKVPFQGGIIEEYLNL